MRQALNEALNEAVAAQTQRLDLQVQTSQAQLARREFLPKSTLTSQLEQANSDASGLVNRSRLASAGAEASLKLRSGTTLTAAIGRSAVTATEATASKTKTTTSSVGLTQPLLRGSGREAVTVNENLAALELSSAQQGFESAMSDQVMSCVLAYFGLEQAKQNVLLARATADRAAQVGQVNEALLAAGRIARTDMLQSEADQAQAGFGVAQAVQAEKVAARQLLRLIGRDEQDDVTVELSDSFGTYLVERDFDEDTAMQDVLARRMDLKQARDNVAMARLALVGARDNLRNQLDLYAKVDHQTATADARERTTSHAVGLILSIPLDKTEYRTAATNAQAAVTKAELQLKELKRNVLAETRDTIQAIHFSREQYRLAQRTAKMAEQRQVDEVEKARVGRSSATDLSFAQETLRQARSQEVQAQYAIFTAQLDYQRATGTVLEHWQVMPMVRSMLLEQPLAR